MAEEQRIAAGLQVKDGRLVFASEADLDRVLGLLGDMNPAQLDAWEKQLGFFSMRTSHRPKEQSASGAEEHDLLEAVLSPNGILQVGQNAYRIDPVKDSVLVAKNIDAASMKSLERGEKGRRLLQYSTEESVILAVESPEGARCCHETSSATRSFVNTYQFVQPTGALPQRLHVTVFNKNGGVQFSLSVRCRTQQLQGGSWVFVPLYGHQVRADLIASHVKPRCKAWERKEIQKTITIDTNQPELSATCYSRTRGLYKYWVASTWSVRASSSLPWQTSPQFVSSWNYP